MAQPLVVNAGLMDAMAQRRRNWRLVYRRLWRLTLAANFKLGTRLACALPAGAEMYVHEQLKQCDQRAAKRGHKAGEPEQAALRTSSHNQLCGGETISSYGDVESSHATIAASEALEVELGAARKEQ